MMESRKEPNIPSKKQSPKKSKFVGVRQRPSGKWVAEIKNTTQKIRMWLGTFDTAEKAARAYDEAAFILRGSNTRMNFVNDGKVHSTLSSRIRNILILKKRKHSLGLAHSNNVVTSCEKNETGELGVFNDGYKPAFDVGVSQFDQTLVENEEINGMTKLWDNLYVSQDAFWDFHLLSQQFLTSNCL